MYFAFDDLASMATFWGTHGHAGAGGFTYHQYTGLNDKHGKEIYCQDILREDLRRRYLVTWFDNGWALQEVNYPHGGYRHFKDAQHMDVIGNSCEQPEHAGSKVEPTVSCAKT
ncbi:MAG: hypothetical protein NVSMB42_14030 [Herpetosiphon sp.]